MANVLNRTTFEYKDSVHTPDYSPTDWIINPTSQEMNDAAIQRQALIDAQIAADAPYQTKDKVRIMAELWYAMTPITEDIVGSRMVVVDGVRGFEDYVITPKDTPEVVSSKLERAARWQASLTTPAFQMFSLFLDNQDYTRARLMGQKMVADKNITQEDFAILDKILPLVR